MSFEVVHTPDFKRAIKKLHKKYPSLWADLEKLAASLAKEPRKGTPIGQGCYKVRLAISSKGKGKSGGASVITYVYVTKKKVYLFSIYDKSQQESMASQKITAMLDAIANTKPASV
jgi:mRNA-degrading endonuclease RelE of RelBE toxin-antitoxin system